MVEITIENGKAWSPVLGRWVLVTLPMRRLIRALNTFGYVDQIRDGGTVGTVVALMDRKILRECKGLKGRHYPATTPAQVYAEAWVDHGLRICDEIDAEEGAAPTGTRTDMPCLAMTGDRRYSGGLRAANGHDHLIATGPECNDAWSATRTEPRPGWVEAVDFLHDLSSGPALTQR